MRDVSCRPARTVCWRIFTFFSALVCAVIATSCGGRGAQLFGGLGTGIDRAATAVSRTLYLHGTGKIEKSDTLYLDQTAPVAAATRWVRTSGLSNTGDNPWREVGLWDAAPSVYSGELATLQPFRAWLGLVNADDTGANFDLRAEVYKNSTLVASGETYLITGLVYDPALAEEAIVNFAPFTPVNFNGTSDSLRLKVLARMGTDGNGNFGGGPDKAKGLRLDFDSITRPSRLGASPTNIAPTANANAAPTSGTAPLSVDFSAAGSTDSDGSIVAWAWDFGDGGGFQDYTGSAGDANHVYSAGDYTATLRVTDNDGATGTDTVAIHVNAAPTAQANASPDSGTAPLEVSFTATGSGDSDGTIAQYEWDFGDGSGFIDFTNTSGAASHSYTAFGTYTATLRVTDDEGAQALATLAISVNGSPVAQANADPTSGDSPLLVNFTTTGSNDPDGTIAQYEWDFGAGGGYQDFTSTSGAASHSYAGTGSFTATLRVTDNSGAQHTDSVEIMVNGVPSAVANATPTEGNAPLLVDFCACGSSDPDGAIAQWEWDFGEGAGFQDFSSTSGATTYTYTNAGSFTATLRVTDNSGSQDTDSVVITVTAAEWAHTLGWNAPGEYEYFKQVAVDSAGNIFAVGITFSAASDIIVSKWTAAGQLLWYHTWDSGTYDNTYGCATDGSNLYVTDLNAVGAGTTGTILKFGPGGNLIWSKYWYPGSQGAQFQGIQCDAAGDLFITGAVNPGPNNANRLLILKLDGDGNQIWARDWESGQNVSGKDIDLGNDAITVSGSSGTAAFVGRFDNSGNLLWIKSWTPTGGVFPGLYGLGVNSSGSVGAAGYLIGGPNADSFVLRLDNSGNPLFQRRWAGTGEQWLLGADIDDSGNIYAAGYSNQFGGLWNLALLKIGPTGGLANGQRWSHPSESYNDGQVLIGADGRLLLTGDATNASGTWQSASYSLSSGGGTFSTPVGTQHTLTGVTLPITGTLATPSATLDTGGGQTDALLIKHEAPTGTAPQTPPTAAITASPSSGSVPLSVNFNAGGSDDLDGTITQYEWDWEGNGSYDFNSGATSTASHLYTATGTYNATVRVTDNDGFTASASATVTVTGPPDWRHSWGTSQIEVMNDLALGDGALISAGSNNSVGRAIAIRHNLDGSFAWARQYGASGSNHTFRAVAADSSGASLSAGSFANSGSRGLLVKLDGNGNLQLQRQFVGPSGNCQFEDAAFDGAGTMLATGRVFHSGNHAYLAKLDSGGNLLWEKLWRGTSEGWAYAVASDALDNVYVGGVGNSFEAVLAKFDAAGTLLWSVDVGGSNVHELKDIAIAADGTVFVLGYGSPSGTATMVAKLNPSGTLLASRWIQGISSLDHQWSLALASDKTVYVTSYPSAGTTAVDVIRLDGAGSLAVTGHQRWTPGVSMQIGLGLACDSLGAAYLGTNGNTNAGSWSNITGTYGSFPVPITPYTLTFVGAGCIVSDPGGSLTNLIGTIDTGGGGSDAVVVRRTF